MRACGLIFEMAQNMHGTVKSHKKWYVSLHTMRMGMRMRLKSVSKDWNLLIAAIYSDDGRTRWATYQCQYPIQYH